MRIASAPVLALGLVVGAIVGPAGCGRIGFDGASDASAAIDVAVCTSETCNGRDDDCDMVVDEGACVANCTGATFGSHTYELCDPSDWTSARTDCESRALELARIDSAPENDWLLAEALPRYPADGRLHLGGNDLAVEGEWRWTDGDLFWNGSAVLYENWGGIEPTNQGGIEHCLEMRLTVLNVLQPGEWNDQQCSVSKPYVCRSP